MKVSSGLEEIHERTTTAVQNEGTELVENPNFKKNEPNRDREVIDRCCVINTANTNQLSNDPVNHSEEMKCNNKPDTYIMSRNSREFKELMARLEKTTAQSSFHHSALVAVYEGLLDYFPIAEMLWRRPTEHNVSDVIDCTETEATAKDEPPEDNTTNTDDTSKDDISEVDMSTDSSSRELDSDPKQTGKTWVSHSFEEVVKHVNEVNGTFYGSALLDQIESFARVGNPQLLLENSAERKRERVPLMGVVDLTKGDTVMTSGNSQNDEKNDVEEDVSTVEE